MTYTFIVLLQQHIIPTSAVYNLHFITRGYQAIPRPSGITDSLRPGLFRSATMCAWSQSYYLILPITDNRRSCFLDIAELFRTYNTVGGQCACQLLRFPVARAFYIYIRTVNAQVASRASLSYLSIAPRILSIRVGHWLQSHIFARITITYRYRLRCAPPPCCRVSERHAYLAVILLCDIKRNGPARATSSSSCARRALSQSLTVMIAPTAAVLAFVPLSLALTLPTTLPSTTGDVASSYVGATTTFQFPPAGVTPASPGNDPDFPDASEVGYAGPTPTGDEALSIETAPAIAVHVGVDPVVRPDTADKKGSKFDMVRSWGSLTPWFSLPADTWGLPESSPVVPKGCDIQQVHILHRHGARYPTSGSGPSTFAAKLHNITVNGTGFSASGPADFLNSWQFSLGAEILTPLGREQLYELGVNARVRYGALLKGFTDLPVWRTTSEARMVDSALQFAAGFFGVQDYATSYHQLIQIEEDGFNSTLAPYYDCPNSNLDDNGYLGYIKAAEWANVYAPPIIKRLSKYIHGVNLTSSDIVAMQDLCAYESVALGYSSFCDLFTQSDWESYEYWYDLAFWYSDGPGGATTASQGIGYVQELIARLTQTPITTFDTTTNATLDGSNITFPLNQPIFVDASHDTIISSIAVALNLTSLAESGPLPTDHIKKDRKWIVSHVAPFATNLVGQVLSCPASGTATSGNSTATHFRWILNDAVVPLTGLKGCKENKDGLCELDAYIEGTKARIEEVDFAFDCFANYTVPDPDLITDGRASPSVKNSTA